jgi:hypothetical protein
MAQIHSVSFDVEGRISADFRELFDEIDGVPHVQLDSIHGVLKLKAEKTRDWILTEKRFDPDATEPRAFANGECSSSG